MPKGGPIEVDLSSPAVNQLWDNVRRIMNMASFKMRPFLKLFGIVEGNGLTPFAADIETTDELLKMVNDYFKPPERDIRGFTDTEDEENVSDDDDLHPSKNVFGDNGLSPDVLESFIKDIAETEAMMTINTSDSGAVSRVQGSVSVVEGSETNPPIQSTAESFFNDVNSSRFFVEFKLMLECEKIDAIGMQALKVMELLQLGKMEKGSISSKGRYRSLNARWFGCKMKKSSAQEQSSMGKATPADKCMISRDTLVKFRVKRGKNESVEHFRVLAIFSKHYNKWFIHWESDSVEYVHNSKKFKILARMVKSDRMNSYSEVNLEAGGQWDTKSVFTLRLMSDIVSVDGVLDSSHEW